MALQLSDGEHIVFEGHPSWRSTLAFYLKGLLGVVVLAALVAGISSITEDSAQWGWATGAFLIVLAAVLVVGWVKRIATTYTITNRRLHIKRGIVARRTQDARLERVQNVNTDQSAIERMLRVGTVDFDTAGTDDHDFQFEGVADPTQVVEAVDRAQREQASEPGGFGRRGDDPSPRGAGL
jgi:uncharacterized membrane protein YdbT with pleckstrin-like domain